MEERKSMGSALVDVFDAGVVLVKSEINGVTKKVTEMAKAKGIGAVLLLAATGPLLMGLIFLILFVFFGLMRLGMGAWAAALVIAIFSLGLAGGLAAFGIHKLSAEVESDWPRHSSELNELPAVAAPVVPVPSSHNHKVAGHGHHHDPNLQNPEVIRDAPGIAVSTDPTFREDMKKEGY